MTQEPKARPPPRLRSTSGKATLTMVESNACIAVASIRASVAAFRPESRSICCANPPIVRAGRYERESGDRATTPPVLGFFSIFRVYTINDFSQRDKHNPIPPPRRGTTTAPRRDPRICHLLNRREQDRLQL